MPVGKGSLDFQLRKSKDGTGDEKTHHRKVFESQTNYSIRHTQTKAYSKEGILKRRHTQKKAYSKEGILKRRGDRNYIERL